MVLPDEQEMPRTYLATRSGGRSTQQRNQEGGSIAYVVKPTDHTLRGRNVRLIDQSNNQVGILSFSDAMDRARDAGLDLVMVAPQATPPVCRIMNYGKFQYEQSKKVREAKKKQVHQKLKEVKFHPNIDDHDFENKVTRALAFLEKGNKVKFSIYLRGRENAHADRGFELMERVAQITEPAGNAERPQKTGRMILMFVSPRAGKH